MFTAKSKGVIPVLIIVLLCVVGVGSLSYGTYYWYKLPRAGWQKLQGCVSSTGVEAKYAFYGKDTWQLVTKDMGCGQTYPDAESWGLKDKNLGYEVSDVAQITVLLASAKPNENEKNAFAYFQVPGKNNLYLELGRITGHFGSETIGITDKEWQYVKNSFRFR